MWTVFTERKNKQEFYLISLKCSKKKKQIQKLGFEKFAYYSVIGLKGCVAWMRIQKEEEDV